MREFLTHAVYGAPVWCWAVVLVLGVLHEWLTRTKLVRANSVVQAVFNVLRKTPLFMVPGLKQFIDTLDTPDAPGSIVALDPKPTPPAA